MCHAGAMVTDTRTPTALVTGASAGLGTEFARQLARRGNHMVLVARNRERLDALAAELGGAEILIADLTTPAGIESVVDRVRDPLDPVDTVVNNAGFALHDPFLRSQEQEEDANIDIMVRAVTRICHAAAPGMVDRGHGLILNVSSVSALLSSGTYSAAKAFVLTLTESLAADLTGTGVHASVVLPGFTRTEFHQRAHLDMSSLPDWMWLDSGEVARIALDDAEYGTVISVPGVQYKAITTLLRLLPRSVVRQISSGAHRPSWNSGTRRFGLFRSTV